MADPEPEDVTLSTIHGALKAGFADVKATLISGFANMPTRESSEEMVRLLRERNQLQEEWLARP